MAAGTAPIECPDPSVHKHDQRLQDQASKAALYVTHPEAASDTRKSIPALGPDGKLSSAGAAASLKHAQPHELPSFPVVGIDSSSSGNKAATLAHANQKPFEHWKPDLSSTAGKAALLAHKDGGKLDLWQPSASDTGHSAAGIAMGKQRGLSPQLDYGYTDEGKKRALLAATLSVAGHGKPPPQPEPAPKYPDAENASANALNAATVAHRPSSVRGQEPIKVSSAANEASRITHLGPNVNRDMFTSHPNFDNDEEVTKQHALRGATLSVERDRVNKEKESEVAPPLMGSDSQTISKNYLALQEQAHKLAQERLAKLDPDGVTAYREHYGYTNSPPRSKLSIRNRRSRAASNEEDDEDEDDAANARRIRSQMNKFNDSLADADAKKRQKDRSSVLAAAEKNVRARMSTIDQDIFDQTGKVTPQMMEQWEAKARAKAAGESEKRLENHGMVHIGGGKYMDQSEIDAIAQGRMQPTLDEINDNAEKQRQRDEEIRQDQEERKRIAALEKARKEDEKMQAKVEKDQQKQYQKEVKDQEKDEKRLQKEQRKRQDLQWRKEQEDAKAKTDDPTAKELDAGAVGATAALDSGGYSAKASGSPAVEEPVATTGGQTVHTGVPAEATPAEEIKKEDPPGVPTDFGQQNPHTESGAFHGDSGASARKAENDQKLEEIGVDREPTSSGTTTSKKDKRESRVRSFFGKFKRNSRNIDTDITNKEAESVSKHEDPVEAAKEADGRHSTATVSAAGAATVGTAAVGTAALASETHKAHETTADEPSAQEKSDEFHKAIANATDDDDEEDGLYSEPTREVHPTATAAAATAPTTQGALVTGETVAPVAPVVPVASELSADAGATSGSWASATQHEVEARGNSVDVSRPSTAVPATQETSSATATTAPEEASVRNSLATTSDEYEEARDKFDEDDSHETATLKAPESARRVGGTSPSRPTSKFQEEL